MKTFVIAVILILLSSPVFSHPGKTDRRGGHKCLKGCAEWGLEYKEYHLHAENFRPIKPDAINMGIMPAGAERSSSSVAIPNLSDKEAPVEDTGRDKGKEEIPSEVMPDRKDMVVIADMWTVNPVFLLSAALLLLLMLALLHTSGKWNKDV